MPVESFDYRDSSHTDGIETNSFQQDTSEELKKLSGDVQHTRKKTGINKIENPQDVFENSAWKALQHLSSYHQSQNGSEKKHDNLVIPENTGGGQFTDKTREAFHELREEGNTSTDKMKLHRAARRYLESHRGLSDEEYQELFAGKEDLRQGQIGDCFVVSGIIELANADYFDELMTSSMRSLRFKDGSEGYSVRVPLGEPHGRDILIKKSELALAKIKGGDGFKLLELAYIKNRRPNNHDGNRYTPVSEGELAKINEGGNTREFLQKFLGHENISFNTYGTYEMWKGNQRLSELPSPKKQEICNFLKNYDETAGNKFVELDTAHSAQGDRAVFRVGENIMYYNHAYALDGVVKDSQGNIQSIRIKNPWNDPSKIGGSMVSLSLPEFLNTFSYMEIGTIKVDKLMDEENDIVAADFGEEISYVV